MLADTYPLYLNNRAVQPNTDLAVTDKYTGEVAFHTALATPDVIDAAIAGAVRAAQATKLPGSILSLVKLCRCLSPNIIFHRFILTLALCTSARISARRGGAINAWAPPRP